MNINYDYYRIFYHVAKYQNFTQAANVLMNNQPNITRTIKNLENELGCPLFIRSNRGVKLTPEGEKLYAHIRIAVEQIQAGEEELSMDKSLQSGIVSIGASEVALRCFLLPVLKDYQQRYSGVRLRVSNHSTPQAITALKSGSVDIALVTTPTGKLNALKAQNVKEIREIAVCGTAFANLVKKQMSLAEISKMPIVSLGPQTKTYEFYSEWFLQHGLVFTPDIEASTADQILPMVKNNLGIGFVPQEFLADEDADNVISLQLKEQIPPRSICLIKRTDQTLSIAAKELERMILKQKPLSCNKIKTVETVKGTI